MVEEKQSWHTCKYAFGGYEVDEKEKILDHYSCCHRLVAESGGYFTGKLDGKPAHVVFYSRRYILTNFQPEHLKEQLFNNQPIKNLETLFSIFPEAKNIEEEKILIQRAIAGCKHCKFYKEEDIKSMNNLRPQLNL